MSLPLALEAHLRRSTVPIALTAAVPPPSIIPRRLLRISPFAVAVAAAVALAITGNVTWLTALEATPIPPTPTTLLLVPRFSWLGTVTGDVACLIAVVAAAVAAGVTGTTNALPSFLPGLGTLARHVSFLVAVEAVAVAASVLFWLRTLEGLVAGLVTVEALHVYKSGTAGDIDATPNKFWP